MLGRALTLSTLIALASCGSSETDDEPPSMPIPTDAGAAGDDGGGGESGSAGAPSAGGAGGAGGVAEEGGAGGVAGEGGAGGVAEEGGAGGAGPTTIAPETLYLEGSATSEPNADGEHVECSFYGELLELAFDEEGSFTGLIAGEVFRTVFDEGNELAGFSALLGGEASLTQAADGSVQLSFVGDHPDTASEFWLELEVITGEHAGDYHYAGSWTCSPILLNEPGFMDRDIDAEGVWTLEPP